MSTPSEHAPTEPQPALSGEVPPTRATHARPSGGPGSAVDRLYRWAVVVIAAVLVIFLILVLAGYPLHMKIDKSKTGGHHGVKHSQPAP
jgi:hypothetical protein